jgi:hypothetical protein
LLPLLRIARFSSKWHSLRLPAILIELKKCQVAFRAELPLSV